LVLLVLELLAQMLLEIKVARLFFLVSAQREVVEGGLGLHLHRQQPAALVVGQHPQVQQMVQTRELLEIPQAHPRLREIPEVQVTKPAQLMAQEAAAVLAQLEGMVQATLVETAALVLRLALPEHL
jgi:hypothetical protein